MLPKSQMGKIKLPDSLRALVETQQKANDLKIVFVEPKHIFALSELPEIHKDPFDRLLIAQANVENVFLVSADSVFEKYPVKFLW